MTRLAHLCRFNAWLQTTEGKACSRQLAEAGAVEQVSRKPRATHCKNCGGAGHYASTCRLPRLELQEEEDLTKQKKKDRKKKSKAM